VAQKEKTANHLKQNWAWWLPSRSRPKDDFCRQIYFGAHFWRFLDFLPGFFLPRQKHFFKSDLL